MLCPFTYTNQRRLKAKAATYFLKGNKVKEMSKGSINFNESVVEWYTPKYIIDKFGSFDYDPSTTEERVKEFGIPNFDTIETDGLKRDWTKFNKIWINPPFNKKKEFLKKAVDSFLTNDRLDLFILLPVSYLCTKTFHDIYSKSYDIYLPNGRIKFETGKGENPKSPAFGSVIVRISYCCNLNIYPFEV